MTQGQVSSRRRKPLSAAEVQGFYYLITGVWPLLDMRSFEMITGPKKDKWLVKTVGVLVSAIGLTLVLNEKNKVRSPEIAGILAGASALGLAIIDVNYVLKKVIRKIYLSDAMLEVFWASILIEALRQMRRAFPPKTGDLYSLQSA